MYADYHVHTEFSDDSVYPLEDVIKDAIRMNMVKKCKNYSVLGHMDLITRYDKNGLYPFEKIKPFVEEILKIAI